MTSSRSPSPSPRLIARGNWTNLLLFLLIVSAGYVGWVFLSPRLTAYEAKAAVKRACVGYMNIILIQESEERWRREFLSRMRGIGLPLRDDQYQFERNSDCSKKKCSCKAQAAFALTTPWPFLEDFFPDIPPYRSVHRIDVDVDYRSEWH